MSVSSDMLDESSVEPEVRQQEKRILRCPAEGCGKIFRSSPGYRYHLKSHDSDPRPHQCQCCMKKFKSANGLKYHLRKSHSIEPVVSKIKNTIAIARNEERVNGNESESTGDDDCVVPSLPPEELIPKQRPHQHETVLRMSNSFSDYKNDSRLKTEPDQTYRSDHDLNSKRLEANRDHNNNYPRLRSFEDNHNICYGSQAESTIRYGAYPESNNNLRYGVESSTKYGCTEEVDNIRIASQGYSPKPSYRDFSRESFREGIRSDLHQRSGPVQDYYLQRSLASQDRYQSGVGYSRTEPPSRFNYPKFEYSVRSYGLNRGDYMKPDNYFRSQSQYETRSEFQKPNENIFRSPNDMNRSDYTVLKSGETVFRGLSARSQVAPKSGADEFVKPTVSRQEFSFRHNASESDSLNKAERTAQPIPSSSRSQETNHSVTEVKTEIEENEYNLDSSQIKQSPRTDINGNTVVESAGILKRRSSKSVPPALVIETPASSNDDKKDENSRLLPPEVNRLTEFAEFATSPHSPLVQSPFPLTLTPGLLGAGSTPDWMTKSFTRFFFPDKPPSYLNNSGLSTSRHTQDDDENEGGRINSSSLPPSPFIDNVSTPQPFWTSQAWPTPIWHCFIKGCSVKFENKDEEFRKVEDIACCNSLLNKKNEEANYAVNGLVVVDIKETKDSLTISKGAKDRVVITFESTTPGQPRLFVKCPVDHLFLVKHRGWSSPCPNEAMARYGIPFRCLQKGDTCIQSTQHKDTNANTLSPLVSSSEAFPFSSNDSSAANVLSAMAKRQEGTFERPPPVSLVSTSSLSVSSPTAESVSSTTTATYSPGDPFPRDVPYSMVITNNDQPLQGQDDHQEDQPRPLHLKKAKRRRKANNLEEKQRRPMNGFMLFAKKMRIELTQKFPGKDNRAISKVLGEQWRTLTADKRQEFALKAKVMADERRKINPDCWKRKRKKSKDIECEMGKNNFKLKKQKPPGSVGDVKGNGLPVV